MTKASHRRTDSLSESESESETVMNLIPTGWRGWIFDIRLAATFLIRLQLLPSLSLPASVSADTLGRALRVFPLIGSGIGLYGATVYTVLTTAMHVPPLLGSLLSLAAMTGLTGGLHEDGLADTADGLCAVGSRTHKLAVMRDSCIGTAGTLALIFGVVIRATAIDAIASSGLARVSIAFVLAETVTRATMPFTLMFVPLARSDGLAASLKHARVSSLIPVTLVTMIFPIILAGLLLQPKATLWAIVSAMSAALVVAVFAYRFLGGYTGDVLGAVGYVAGTATLVSLA